MLKLGAKQIVAAKMRDKTTMLVDLRTKTESGAFFSGEYDSNLIGVIFRLLDTGLYFLASIIHK